MSLDIISLFDSILSDVRRALRRTRGMVRKLRYSNTVKMVSRSINRIIR